MSVLDFSGRTVRSCKWQITKGRGNVIFPLKLMKKRWFIWSRQSCFARHISTRMISLPTSPYQRSASPALQASEDIRTNLMPIEPAIASTPKELELAHPYFKRSTHSSGAIGVRVALGITPAIQIYIGWEHKQ